MVVKVYDPYVDDKPCCSTGIQADRNNLNYM